MPEVDSISQTTERVTLGGFLDFYRGVVERKVDGLTLAEASRELTPTGLSPLGVVRHLGWVEYYWFRRCFAGEAVPPPPRTGGDNAVQFQIGPEDTVNSVLEFYRSETEHARGIVSAARSLDAVSTRESRFQGAVSLRWILVHMVEETARHAGHLDIMREMIDGKTGYL
jgi:uncharacterized protein DUF664